MLKRLLVSGYKAHELGIHKDTHPGIAYIKKAIEKELISLIESGLEWIIISGQWGVEIWAAEVVLSLKKQYPSIKLAVITPFLQQEEQWKPDKQEKYRSILKQADFTDSVSKQPYQGVWQFVQKNKFLLKNSDGLLILSDENGSPQYLKRDADVLAETSNYEVISITSYDLQMIVEDESASNDY